jgi:hypothetical protein
MVVVRRYGAPPGAPGVSVEERPASNILADLATVAFGSGNHETRTDVNADSGYVSQAVFRSFWAIRKLPLGFISGCSQQTPDAVEGFWQNGAGAGLLWLTRIDVDGKAKRAKKVLKNWLGADALEIEAANEGRWGGQASEIALTPVLVASARSFTIIAPGTLANEYVGAEVEFESAPGKDLPLLQILRLLVARAKPFSPVVHSGTYCKKASPDQAYWVAPPVTIAIRILPAL